MRPQMNVEQNVGLQLVRRTTRAQLKSGDSLVCSAEAAGEERHQKAGYHCCDGNSQALSFALLSEAPCRWSKLGWGLLAMHGLLTSADVPNFGPLIDLIVAGGA